MDTFSNIMEDFEKLAYKILLSIIILPKTILEITLNPAWVPGYVRGELNKENSSFNNYLSPVILLLVVALIPAIILINFLPSFGVELTSPAEENPTAEHLLEFEAETTSKSSSERIFYKYSWYVEKIGDDGGYEELYRETYDENRDETVITIKGEQPTMLEGEFATYLEYPERKYSLSKDSFYYQFEEPGAYWINVEVTAFDPDRPEGGIIENFYAYRHVSIPAEDEPNQQVVISDLEDRQGTVKESSADISDVLNNETTIFLALGLLFPPLLFALASKLFRGEQISEDMLRENFYIQCYYFSPLSLAIWGTYYAWYFVTPDVFFYQPRDTAMQIILLPALLAFVWFIGTETQAVARERQIGTRKALVIVSVCVAILGSIAWLVYLYLQPYSQVQNNLRMFTIFGYPIAAILLVLAFCLVWIRQRRSENQRIAFRDFSGIAIAILFVYLASEVLSSGLIGSVMNGEPAEPIEATEIADTVQPVSIDIPNTPATDEPSEPTIPAPTPTLPPTQQFFTEEFDGSLDTWIDYKSDENMVSINLENDAAVFQISPRENQTQWGYMINDAFTYTNVLVEAVVTNNGNNSNEISLICQYSERGWYELTFSSGGTYSINAIDSAGTTLLANGAAPVIKTGHATNVISALCRGNELTLFINGTEVQSYTDTGFNLQEGKIGLGVFSPQALPVDVQFESVTVAEP